MVVCTDTPQVAAARRANLQALMDAHRALCATCVRQDTCALRALASTFNLAAAPGLLPEPAPWDADFPLQRDSSKCIKCMRCVAICEKVQHCAVWDFTGVGPSTKIIVRDSLPIAVAGCALCGQCEVICPEHFSMADLCLESRRDAVERDVMPASAHEFALEDMAPACGSDSAFLLEDPALAAACGHSATMFFPGCQLAASRPGQVLAMYR